MSNELKGSEFLLQVEDPTNAGTFFTLGGLKSKSLTMNKESVDVTNHGSQGWRQLLQGAGIQSLDCSGEGVTNKVVQLKYLLEAWKDRRFVSLRLSMKLGEEDVLIIDVNADITSIEFSGENDKEVPYSMSFQSADVPNIEIF